MNLKYLFSTALLVPIIACSATDTVSGTKTDKLANINTYGCKNLHKVTDIDDLLKQMYDNIDSHCLFKMDTGDLEKVWGIKVFNTLKSDSYTDIQNHYDNADGFYVYKTDYSNGNLYFRVSATQKFKKGDDWAKSSLGSGKFPFYLPKPIVIARMLGIHDIVILDDRFKGSDYKEYTSYYWLNSEKSKNKAFLEMDVDSEPKSYSMKLHNRSRNAPIYRKLFNY